MVIVYGVPFVPLYYINYLNLFLVKSHFSQYLFVLLFFKHNPKMSMSFRRITITVDFKFYNEILIKVYNEILINSDN